MSKTFLYLILSGFLALNVTGCSLFGSSDEETETAEISEDGDEFAKDDFESDGEMDMEMGEEGEPMDEEGDPLGDDEFAEEGDEPVGEDDFADEDEYPDDDYAETADEIEAESTDGLDDGDFAVGEIGEDSVMVDEGDIPEETLSSNEEQDLFANESVVEDTQSYDSYEPVEFVGGGASNLVSVKKMKPAAYSRAGANINRLYVVRDGDNMSNVAQKIYGSDRSSDLLAWNGHFAGKSLKVGDKIYYSSPAAPNDPEMKTYYEDNNLAPQFYTSKSGENIRSIAQSLLGNERSWMELYATNPDVTSKWALPTGTQLRYWDGTSAGQPMAQADAPPPAPVDEIPADEPEEDIDLADVEEEDLDIDDPEIADIDEDFDDLDDNDLNPPPAVGSTSVAPPPPPPPAAKVVAPPPPPPPLEKSNSFGKKFANKLNNSKKAPKVQDDSMIMGALGGLLILAAVILLIFIRRSRAKRVNFTQTQV